MLRKLRRLRVPVCFYTCCSLFAILLFVSFNEDVKNLIQQSSSNRASGPSGSSFPSSFSSISSGSSGSSNARPLFSYNSGLDSGATATRAQQWNLPQQTMQEQRQEVKFQSLTQPLDPNTVERRRGGEHDTDDDDVIKQYINDNFVGHPGQNFENDLGAVHHTPQPQIQTTNVISNLVKLAQQASNNPNKFNNINSLTGETIGGQFGDNELSQVFLETHQGTTADTDLLYPGGDANNPIKKRERQWFLTGGDFFPTPPGGLASIFYPQASWLASKPTHIDYAQLWYDNTIGSDRVIEQLMFAIDDPINYANISWGFEGPTATTVRPSEMMLSNLDTDQNMVDIPSNTGLIGVPHQHVHIPPDLNDDLTKSSNQFHLLPPTGDRYSGADPNSILRDPRLGKIKTILLYYGLGMSWGSQISAGRQVFLKQNCPVNACRLTGNRAQLSKADIVVFKDVFMHPKIRRPPNQLWVMYMLECPLNTQNFQEKNAFNLTATYRHDSDIVTPYEKWVYFEDSVRSLPQAINYAEGKTKKVAWFVSNCVAKNNRLEFARELAKYIEVDIYGACGSHTCSRANAKQCFEMLSRNYKFYLAFENSNCRDYISEKFFVNGLGNNVLPIVMGAHPDDYKRVAPDRSYIHVDDFSSAKELAQYLHELDTNDDLYNEYFKWKGTGEFINTHFFCRLCAMAHFAARNPRKPSHYADFNRWWRGPHVCTRNSWRSTPDIFAQENYDAFISNNHN